MPVLHYQTACLVAAFICFSKKYLGRINQLYPNHRRRHGKQECLPLTFGLSDVLPFLPRFMARHPRVRPELHFENRKVDLIAEGDDAAIVVIALSSGIVFHPLASPTSSR